MKEFYSSPSKKGRKVIHGNEQGQTWSHAAEKEDLDSSSDSDYMSGDSGTSEDDVEAVQIQRKFKDFKQKMKKGQVA